MLTRLAMSALLVAFSIGAFGIGSASAVTLCGIPLGDPVSEMDATPIGPAVHLGATIEFKVAPGVCQGVQIGGSKTSPVDGFTEILVTAVANDHGQKSIMTDFVHLPSGNEPFVVIDGQQCRMVMILRAGGGLESTCPASTPLVATLHLGSSGP